MCRVDTVTFRGTGQNGLASRRPRVLPLPPGLAIVFGKSSTVWGREPPAETAADAPQRWPTSIAEGVENSSHSHPAAAGRGFDLCLNTSAGHDALRAEAIERVQLKEKPKTLCGLAMVGHFMECQTVC